MLHSLYQLLIYPIEILLEIVFSVLYDIRHDVGLSILGVSIVVNFLMLPLYNRADRISDEERRKHDEMAENLNHIKRTFKGDERFMILQTFYRKQNYHPLYSLRSSFPLLLQIPFFIAAYHFLSHLSLLSNMSFLWIRNLAAPDGILVIPSIGVDIMPEMRVYPGFCINILPVLMTLINIISTMIYTKGAPLKEKLQLYIMAGIFLVLLYKSPSGLVIYWTMNNVFSLVKNIVLGIVKKKHHVAAGDNRSGVSENRKDNSQLFFSGCILLVLLLGVLIPSSVIVSSPSEFVNVAAYKDPLQYVFGAFLIASGAFLVWLPVFYYLGSHKARKTICSLVWVYCAISLIDFLVFGQINIRINTRLKYDQYPEFSLQKILFNLIILIVVSAVVIFFLNKHWLWIKNASYVVTIALVVLSAVNIINTETQLSKMSYLKNGQGSYEGFTLSTKGKNVIVLMLDRAIGTYFPYILAERPELRDKYAGFTYYPNTISFGGSTKTGSPALFGGYEYSSENIDDRSDEKLVDKQNEALKVMPVLFSEQGYKTTVYDAPLGNYDWISDLSIFDDYPDIKAYSLKERFTDPELDIALDKYRYRSFFLYSIYKSVPLVFQGYVYDDGQYHYPDTIPHINDEFNDPFSILHNLSTITEIEDSDQNTFMMMDNDAPHSVCELQLPDYLPVVNLNNRGLETGYRVDDSGNMIEMDEYFTYHVNISPLIQIGYWLDYLRENDVYDNTRIIIVADHGWPIGQFDDLIQEDGTDMQGVIPLLLYKDFNSAEYSESDEFMTNGDTPVLAMDGLIEDPVNPFTANRIDNKKKYEQDQLVLCEDPRDDVLDTEDTVFLCPGQVWYTVHDNVFDKNNWNRVEE